MRREQQLLDLGARVAALEALWGGDATGTTTGAPPPTTKQGLGSSGGGAGNSTVSRPPPAVRGGGDGVARLNASLSELQARVEHIATLQEEQGAGSTALNQSVAGIHAVIDHLSSKNDSVSYAVHVSAFDAMMARLRAAGATADATAQNLSDQASAQALATARLNQSTAQLAEQARAQAATAELSDRRLASVEATSTAINGTVASIQDTMSRLMVSRAPCCPAALPYVATVPAVALFMFARSVLWGFRGPSAFFFSLDPSVADFVCCGRGGAGSRRRKTTA